MRVGDERRPSRRSGRALSAWRRGRARACSSPGRSGGMCGAWRRPGEGGNPNLTAVSAPVFAPAPRARREGALSGGGPSSCLWKAFVPLGCLALWLFCTAEGGGEKRICLPEFSEHYGEMWCGPVREAQCLPGAAESGDEFIGLSPCDVPSSGFSDSLSDLNTHYLVPMLGPTRSPNICWLKSEALHIMYYMAGNEEGF